MSRLPVMKVFRPELRQTPVSRVADTPSASVVVPVYNSAAGLATLVERLKPVLDSCCLRYELILVNDGSADHSWEVIRQLCADNAWIRGINLMRNYGQHSALLCGIRASRHAVVVTLDDDLQNPPEEIPRLLGQLERGYDVVYGTPRREQHALWRNAASRLTKVALQGAMGIEAARSVSAFRVFRTRVRDGFQHYNGPFVSIDVLLTWSTKRFGAIEVQHAPRALGNSNYTLGKLINHAVNLITGFTTLPLRLATWIGFAFTLFGAVIFGFVLWRYISRGDSVPGFPFIASIVSLFSGAQLFALGIIGEYMARMHFRSMGAPSAVIGERIGMDE